MNTKLTRLTLITAATLTWISGCRSLPPPTDVLESTEVVDDMRPEALTVASGRGAADLSCATTSAHVLEEHVVVDPQDEGWFERPARARYTVTISGCGKEATYAVSCSQPADQCISSEETRLVSPRRR